MGGDVAGDTQKRSYISFASKTDDAAYGNLLHVTKYYRGVGGYREAATEAETVPSYAHHCKTRLRSVNDDMYYHPLLLDLYQGKVKRAMHIQTTRVVSADLAQRQIPLEIMQRYANTQIEGAKRKAVEQFGRAIPEGLAGVASEDMYSKGSVGAVPGGKKYWKQALFQLIGMAMEFGIPQYFLTFTCNERDCPDFTAACGGRSFSARPVEATMHWFHRWDEFNSRFLAHGKKTPLGTVTHKWFRQEDQRRGSLHVHMALWVDPDSIKDGIGPEGITGLAPIVNGTNARQGTRQASQREAGLENWRDFVMKVQYHKCHDNKCFFKNGVPLDDCKYNFPRPSKFEVKFSYFELSASWFREEGST